MCCFVAVQGCLHSVFETLCVHLDRFSLLWNPCIETLAAALEHCSLESWPLLLAQLTTAQASFLSGSGFSATAGGNGGSRLSQHPDPGGVPQLFVELRKAMCSGDANQNGGCTDAAVRLANILKVGKPIQPPDPHMIHTHESALVTVHVHRLKQPVKLVLCTPKPLSAKMLVVLCMPTNGKSFVRPVTDLMISANIHPAETILNC